MRPPMDAHEAERSGSGSGTSGRSPLVTVACSQGLAICMHSTGFDLPLFGREPFLERGVHASLPSWPGRPKCAQNISIKAYGDLLLRRVLVWPTSSAQHLNGCSDPTSRSDNPLTPIDCPRLLCHGSSLRAGTLCRPRGLRNRLRFAYGSHSGKISSARFRRRAVSRSERRLAPATYQGSEGEAHHTVRGRPPP